MRVSAIVTSTLAALTLAILTGAASAQERIQSLSLENAVRLATRDNATLRAKGFEFESVRANELTAGLRPNPTASYLAEQFGLPNSTPQHTVTLGQTIELGGKRERRLDSARAATRVTGHELDDARRQVTFQVKKSFTDALIAREAVALAGENLTALDELEKVQRFRAEKGDISELELLRIQVQRFAFERDALDARQALRAALIAVRALAGPDRIAEDYEIVGELGFREVTLTQSELYRRAISNRPDLRAAEAARDKANADTNLARANAWIDVTPQVEYQRIGPDNTFGFGFSIPLRIFDRNQGEIARTKAEASRVDAVRDAVAIQALSEVDTALAAVRIGRDKLVALRDTYLPKTRQARETVEYAYRRGGVNLLDFLDAQRTYRETSLEYLRALGSYWSAVYQLEAAVSGPVEN